MLLLVSDSQQRLVAHVLSLTDQRDAPMNFPIMLQ